MERFVSTTDSGSLRHVADEASELWSQFGIASQPAWVFIHDDGSFTTVVSALGADGLTEEIQKLLDS